MTPFGTRVRLGYAACKTRMQRATAWSGSGYPVQQAISKETLWIVLDKLALVREWPIMVERINT